MTEETDLGVRPPAPEAGPGSAATAAGAAVDSPATRREPGVRTAVRSEMWAFLELFALCGFVVVQPLLEIIGGSPDFFIFHGVTAGEIMALVAILTLMPPVVLWGIGAMSRLAGARVRRVVHAVTVGLLFVLFAIQLGKYLTPADGSLPVVRGVLLAVLAVVVASVMVAGYVRFAAAKHLLRFAAVGPMVFVLLFTFASPSSAVVFPSDRPGTGGEPQAVGPHPPIVMIVLDELALLSLLDGGSTDGEIDAERFPNFARLAGDSTWWRNASTVAGWTPYALPAMLTGQMPDQHAAPHHAVYPDNLFTLLGEVYRIEASESISALCPPWHCGDRAGAARGGLPVALAESASLLSELISPADPPRDPYDDFAEPTVAERIGEAAAAREDRPEFLFRQALAASQPVRFHEFMNGLAESPTVADDRPTLHFLHLLLPHTPWTYLPDGMRYENVPGLPVDGQWWGRLALQRHLSQLEYTDQLLGETLRLLEETGQYDDALVVLTSDHGVALTPGPPNDAWIAGKRELGPDDIGAEELVWVPLFIKEPGQTDGVVEERNWQHTDLLPTLADYAGVEVPWPVDGISWLRDERTATDKVFVNTVRDDKEVRVLDAPPIYQRLLAEAGAIPPVPPAPLPELVGTPVDAHPVRAGGGGSEVDNAEAFDAVDPGSGVVPALVHGTVDDSVPQGTPLAIAVNGQIGAVVPVVAGVEGARRFAGLVEDVSLFVPGENQLELFLVPDGVTLQRLR